MGSELLPCVLHYFTSPVIGDRHPENSGPVAEDKPQLLPNSMDKETGIHHVDSLLNDTIPASTPKGSGNETALSTTPHPGIIYSIRDTQYIT